MGGRLPKVTRIVADRQRASYFSADVSSLPRLRDQEIANTFQLLIAFPPVLRFIFERLRSYKRIRSNLDVREPLLDASYCVLWQFVI